MLAVPLLRAEKVQVERIAVLSQAHGRLVEQRGPLEGRAVQSLTLRAVAVLGVDRVAVVFEFDCASQHRGLSKASVVKREKGVSVGSGTASPRGEGREQKTHAFHTSTLRGI